MGLGGLRIYAIGEKFPLRRCGFGDGCKFEYLEMGPAILSYYSNPTESEINQFQNGEIFLGMFSYDCVLYLMGRFGGNIVECPFNVNYYTENEWLRGMGVKQNLAIFLIDADTNIVKAMRYICMSDEFAKNLWNKVEEQFDEEFNRDYYERLIFAIEQKYSSKELFSYSEYSMYCDAIENAQESLPPKTYFYY